MEFDGRRQRLSFGPWKRNCCEIFDRSHIKLHSFPERFDTFVYANMDLSIEVKRAAMKVSPSVVSIATFTAEHDVLFYGSGTIVECEDINGVYVSTILTSTTLIRSFDQPNVLEDNIYKIEVHLADDTLLEGKVFFADLHYNLLVLTVESASPLPTCNVQLLDDAISIDPNEILEEVGSEKFQLHPDSDLFKIVPGEMVVALGRFFQTKTPSLMAAPGTFSVDVLTLDCKELFRADCKISICGIGGPVVNRYGQVIGVTFYDISCTPFLPINIASKCLEHFKRCRKLCRPQLGIIFTNLYVASLDKLEIIIRKFPNIVKGVIVEEVIASSNADRSGILSGDVIFECNGYPVGSVLEFLRIMWDKNGNSVELSLVRNGSDAPCKLLMAVEETRPDDVNRKMEKSCGTKMNWQLDKGCLYMVEMIRNVPEVHRK